MEEYVFIGEGFLAELGIQPLFAPLGTNTISFTRIKKYLSYLGKLTSVRVVDGSGLFFHRLYKETIYVSGGAVKVIRVEDLVSEADKVNGDVCDFLRKLPVISYSYGNKISFYLPVIVKYRNWWENLSTAPIKMVKEDAEYYVYKGIGIVVIDRETSPRRPYVRDVLKNPTSTLLANECRIELMPSRKRERKEDIGELFR